MVYVCPVTKNISVIFLVIALLTSLSHHPNAHYFTVAFAILALVNWPYG